MTIFLNKMRKLIGHMGSHILGSKSQVHKSCVHNLGFTERNITKLEFKNSRFTKSQILKFQIKK